MDYKPPVYEFIPYQRTEVLFWVAIFFSLVHSADHILRDTHSGWPFTGEFTGFSVAIMFYPVVFIAKIFRPGPLSYITVTTGVLIYVVITHLTAEPIEAMYTAWADGTNITGLQSPTLGNLSVWLAFAFKSSLLLLILSSAIDGLSYGFTWKRKKTYLRI